jgi:cation:H+ antiporter
MWMIVGIVLLVIGGELLVRYASKLAESAGVPTLLVGLTIVAFGTSSPELITSVYGRLLGESAMALGNVVGSNIFNVFFILGISALVTPLTVHSNLLVSEVPVVLVLSLATVGFALSGTIATWEAGVLLSILVLYTVYVLATTDREFVDLTENEFREMIPVPVAGHWSVSVLLVGVGLVLLVVGGHLFITSAVELAASLGMSEAVIGLTIVAAGTSLPELVTSILAAIRGESDIAVGNVVGSNLFNLTGVLGFTGLIGTGELTVPIQLLEFDLPVMVAGAIVCLPVMFTGRRLNRWEGAVFVLYYAGYVSYLVLEATGYLVTPHVREALLFFVVPLTLVTFFVIAYREITK